MKTLQSIGIVAGVMGVVLGAASHNFPATAWALAYLFQTFTLHSLLPK